MKNLFERNLERWTTVKFFAALAVAIFVAGPPDSPAQNLPALSAQKLTDYYQIHRRFTNGNVNVIVTLASSATPTAMDFRSPAALARLRPQLRKAQQDVLDTLPIAQLKVGFRFDNIAGFSAEVTTNGLLALQALPGVLTIEPVMELEPHLAQGIPLIHGMTYRSTYNGAGLAIAICDTGIDYTHARLGGGGFPNSKVLGGYDFGDSDADPIPNAQAHGTCCAGIAAGDLGTVGDYIGGVAYNAKLYAVKISSGTSGSATTAAMVAAWDWCVTHQNDNPSYPIMVISTSFGGGRYYSACDSTTPSMTTAANNAVAAGITVLASSGNDGYCDSMGWPACISSVISVGAVYDANFGTYSPCVNAASCAPKTADSGCTTGYYATDSTQADRVTSYANVASFLGVFAPGNDCYTLDITGASGYSSGDYYANFGGTSAACPYAAGAVACLQSAVKTLTGSYLTPAEVRSRLAASGVPVTDSKVAITKPRVNLGNMLAALNAPAIVPAGTTLTSESCLAANGVMDPGETVTVQFAVRNAGAANTTNLVGTLNATGGVTSPSGPQTYGVLVGGGPAVNQPFTFTANGTCGGTITAVLQLQDGAANLGSVTYIFTLGALETPVAANYSSGGVAVAIPDNTTVEVPVSITDVGAVSDVNVRVRLNHTWDADLVISLVHPDGTVISLANKRGSSGDNYGSGATDCTGTFTVFDDAAGTAIGSGTAPFAGSYKPDQLLSTLNGKSVTGTWKLRVADTAGGDTGTIYCCQLDITRQQYVCCSGVNGAPALAGIEGTTLSYIENAVATAITAAITVSDADSANMASGSVQITGNYQNGQDVLSYTQEGSIVGTWNSGSATMALSGNDTKANYQLALRAVKYANSSDNPSTSTRTVTFKVNDGTADSNTQTRNLSVTAVNDAPALAAIEGTALSYTENAAATAITAAITVSDADSANMASGSVQITGNYQNGQDVLSYTQEGSIVGTWNSGSATMALSGSDTKANYQLALRAVKYANSSDNPSASTRTVTFKVNDGTADSNTQTRNLSITAVNDAPIANAISDTTSEDTAKTITLSGSDLEACDLTFAIVSTPTKGVLGSITDNTCVTGSPNTDSATVVYTPTANYNGLDTFTYKVTDGGSLSATGTVSITVSPVNDAPGFTKGSDQSVLACAGAQSVSGWATTISPGPANESSQTVDFIVTNNNNGLFSMQPAVSPAGTLTYTLAANSNGVATVRVKIHDNGGTANGGTDTSAEQTNTVTVLDTQAPTLTCPGDITTTNDMGQCFATGVNLGVPVATNDNCGILTVTNNAPATFPVGMNLVTWTAVDTSGKLATCVQTVTVNDTEAPTLTCPADLTTTNDVGQCFATGVSLGVPLATNDNCGILTVTNNAPATFPVGVTPVTWTVVDVHDNTNTCTQVVTILDTELPQFTCPADVTVNGDAGLCYATGVALGTPATSDNCGILTVTNDAPAAFTNGVTAVIWTAVDTSGNLATCVQNVTVSAEAGCTMGCMAINVALGSPVTGDNCSVASVANNAPAVYPLGTNVVTWTVTDGSGNMTTLTQRVIVLDLTAPTISCPADVTVSANAGSTATNVTLSSPVTRDNCSVASVANNAPAAYPMGTNIVIWTVTDGSGNTNYCVQTVTVLDTQAPTITCPADITTTNGVGLCSAVVDLGMPVATNDNCEILTVTNNAPTTFQVGTTPVTWTAVDTSGNLATCVQTVTVNDTEAPTLTCPADLTTTNDVGQFFATGVSLGMPGATNDNCGILTVTNNAPATFPVGTNLVTWTVVDVHDNTNTCVQTVTVINLCSTTPPVITWQYNTSSGTLELAWSGTCFRLQAQTNSLSVGITTNSSDWFNYPGGTNSPVIVTNDPANPCVFYRLVWP